MQSITCPIGQATLMAYLLHGEEKRPSVVICPGGGYRFVSPRESAPVAHAFNRAGYNAFVLEYDTADKLNVQTPLGNTPIQQLAWAVSTVRHHAEKFGVNQTVYVAGFSAGGHLAASLGVLWHDESRFGGRTVAENRRPDGMILSYPVISSGEFAHKGSFENLAGEDDVQQAKWSLELHVSEKTVPTFIWHTFTDATVPVENTLLFSQHLCKFAVPHEVHLYPFGIHGLSLATAEVETDGHVDIADEHVATWFSLATGWLQTMENYNATINKEG